MPARHKALQRTDVARESVDTIRVTEILMGFRFQRRVKILPGVRLNVSKGGVSTSLGTRGASITLGRRKRRTTVGIPGSGLSHISVDAVGDGSPSVGVGAIVVMAIVIVLLVWTLA